MQVRSFVVQYYMGWCRQDGCPAAAQAGTMKAARTQTAEAEEDAALVTSKGKATETALAVGYYDDNTACSRDNRRLAMVRGAYL